MDNKEKIENLETLLFSNQVTRTIPDADSKKVNGKPYMYYGVDNKFPQYDKNISSMYPGVPSASLENKMSGIQLGPDQFPILASNLCKFVNEGI